MSAVCLTNLAPAAPPPTGQLNGRAIIPAKTFPATDGRPAVLGFKFLLSPCRSAPSLLDPCRLALPPCGRHAREPCPERSEVQQKEWPHLRPRLADRFGPELAGVDGRPPLEELEQQGTAVLQHLNHFSATEVQLAPGETLILLPPSPPPPLHL